MPKPKQEKSLCPCGSGLAYSVCCGQYLAGQSTAPDAQALMRSRYTAYVESREDYLRATWHPRTCPTQILDLQSCKWIGLNIVRYTQQDAKATVEFIARYKIHGRAHQMHEISQFELEDGRWLYVEGQFPDQT